MAESTTTRLIRAPRAKVYRTVADIGALGGAQVTVRHEGIPAGIDVRDNERGTESSLENLARLVERPGAIGGGR